MDILIGGASNVKGINARIILEGPGELLIKQVLKFEFKVSKNKAKYEALITDKVLAIEMGTSRLKAKRDSQLVAHQFFR